METFSIYGVAAFLSALLGPIFYPQTGAIYGGSVSGVMIGVQFMGVVAVLGWAGVISSIYFFAALRLGYLRLSIAEQVLGMDAVEDAKQANIDIKEFMEKINKAYPKLEEKRCC